MPESPRPAHWSSENAAAFQLPDVIDAYHLRTPYPRALGASLCRLMRPAVGSVLEVGCGTGEIARMLAPRALRVDAIDISAGMLARGRALPGGDDSRLRWIHGTAEDAPLGAPYALAVAGDALHWMTWEVVLPRLGAALAPDAVLALVTAVLTPPPWAEALRDLIRRYSAIRNYVEYDLVLALADRGLFDPLGNEEIGAEPFARTTDEYIGGLHAMAGLARSRMGSAGAGAFDEAVRALVEPHEQAGVLYLTGGAAMTWGRPRTI